MTSDSKQTLDKMEQIATYGFDAAEGVCHAVKVYGSAENPWFRANDVGNALGLTNIRATLNKADIPSSWMGVNPVDTPGGIQQCTFINEAALYTVIMRSNKPNAIAFRKWVCGEVLPAIRKTGKYDMTQKSTEDRRLEIYNTVFSVFQRLGMDDRDRLMFQDYGRTLLLSDAKEIPIEMSISRRLQEYFGIRNPKRSLLITLGRHISKRYRELHGDSPPQREQFVDGATRMVYHYTLADFTEYADLVIAQHLRRLRIPFNEPDEITMSGE